MYTVKRFETGEILTQATVNGKTLGYTTQARCYAVMTPESRVNQVTNRLTGKVELEVFSRKQAAERQADWYNSNPTKERTNDE